MTRVLLCDEDHDFAVMLGVELGLQEDAEIVGVANDARRAVELAERHEPDVVLLSVSLPHTEEIRPLQRLLTRRVPPAVVALADQAGGARAADALRMGARRSVTRSQELEEIVRSIREAAATRPADAPAVPTVSLVVVGGGPDLGESVKEAVGDGPAVVLAPDAATLLARSGARVPDLVVIDATVAELDAEELVRRLRSERPTRDVPVILIVDASTDPATVARIAVGANDYLIRPFDEAELGLRMRSALRRSHELTAMNPLTFLPGNVQIELELKRRTAAGHLFALMYIDLDNFKAYNDHYGFLRGDEVIKLEASCTMEVVRKHARGGFVGHVGGDDMIAIVEAGAAEMIAQDIVRRWDRMVLTLYDPEDAARGYIEVADRLGEVRRFPLSTISIGIATNSHRPIRSHWEASEIATEMKRFAKREEGSSYAFDRRLGAERRSSETSAPHEGEGRRIIRLDG
jgi:diguanylate cyclase (GGDEF)-like protein